jgi:B-cell receptor-associated protein 31
MVKDETLGSSALKSSEPSSVPRLRADPIRPRKDKQHDTTKMAIQYEMVFGVLCAQVIMFICLLIPVPLQMRHKMSMFLHENPIVQRVQYFLKTAFVFVFVLFLDAVNGTYKASKDQHSSTGINAVTGLASDSGIKLASNDSQQALVKLFRSQRNLYLCGGTLFMSLFLNRYIDQVRKVISLEMELTKFDEKENQQLSGRSRVGEKEEISMMPIGDKKKKL